MDKMMRRGGFGHMASLWDEMNDLFEQHFGGRSLMHPLRGVGRWAPSVDMYETDEEVVVKAEVPGMSKEDLEVTVTEEAVAISGETTAEEEATEENYTRRERRYGKFTRRLPLPAAVHVDEATAKFADGILEVRVPKEAEPEEEEGRKIEIE
ncbi:MAG: Hsp20/alpha crystallin family protein [Armatimonadota bacterium]|jgi:HSP20 family protein